MTNAVQTYIETKGKENQNTQTEIRWKKSASAKKTYRWAKLFLDMLPDLYIIPCMNVRQGLRCLRALREEPHLEPTPDAG